MDLQAILDASSEEEDYKNLVNCPPRILHLSSTTAANTYNDGTTTTIIKNDNKSTSSSSPGSSPPYSINYLSQEKMKFMDDLLVENQHLMELMDMDENENGVTDLLRQQQNEVMSRILMKSYR